MEAKIATTESAVPEMNEIVKSLSFEVEAIPQDNVLQLTSTANSTPLNVKIKVRKKHGVTDAQNAVITLPRIGRYNEKSPPERIRLVSSDQTIMSFNMHMESGKEAAVTKKPGKNFFGRFKPGGCLDPSNDEDNYPYLAKPIPIISEKNKTDQPATTSAVLPLNKPINDKDDTDSKTSKNGSKMFILGKCKPGGCLDPPFGEDKYSYTPAKPIATEAKDTTKKRTSIAIKESDPQLTNKIDNLKEPKRKTPDKHRKSSEDSSVTSLYKAEIKKNKLDSSCSSSLITYPPDFSELQKSNGACEKNMKNRSSIDEKHRRSFSNTSENYFQPRKESATKKKITDQSAVTKNAPNRTDILLLGHKLEQSKTSSIDNTNKNINKKEDVIKQTDDHKSKSVSQRDDDETKSNINNNDALKIGIANELKLKSLPTLTPQREYKISVKQNDENEINPIENSKSTIQKELAETKSESYLNDKQSTSEIKSTNNVNLLLSSVETKPRKYGETKQTSQDSINGKQKLYAKIFTSEPATLVTLGHDSPEIEDGKLLKTKNYKDVPKNVLTNNENNIRPDIKQEGNIEVFNDLKHKKPDELNALPTNINFISPKTSKSKTNALVHMGYSSPKTEDCKTDITKEPRDESKDIATNNKKSISPEIKKGDNNVNDFLQNKKSDDKNILTTNGKFIDPKTSFSTTTTLVATGRPEIGDGKIGIKNTLTDESKNILTMHEYNNSTEIKQGNKLDSGNLQHQQSDEKNILTNNKNIITPEISPGFLKSNTPISNDEEENIKQDTEQHNKLDIEAQSTPASLDHTKYTSSPLLDKKQKPYQEVSDTTLPNKYNQSKLPVERDKPESILEKEIFNKTQTPSEKKRPLDTIFNENLTNEGEIKINTLKRKSRSRSSITSSFQHIFKRKSSLVTDSKKENTPKIYETNQIGIKEKIISDKGPVNTIMLQSDITDSGKEVETKKIHTDNSSIKNAIQDDRKSLNIVGSPTEITFDNNVSLKPLTFKTNNNENFDDILKPSYLLDKGSISHEIPKNTEIPANKHARETVLNKYDNTTTTADNLHNLTQNNIIQSGEITNDDFSPKTKRVVSLDSLKSTLQTNFDTVENSRRISNKSDNNVKANREAENQNNSSSYIQNDIKSERLKFRSTSQDSLSSSIRKSSSSVQNMFSYKNQATAVNDSNKEKQIKDHEAKEVTNREDTKNSDILFRKTDSFTKDSEELLKTGISLPSYVTNSNKVLKTDEMVEHIKDNNTFNFPIKNNTQDDTYNLDSLLNKLESNVEINTSVDDSRPLKISSDDRISLKPIMMFSSYESLTQKIDNNLKQIVSFDSTETHKTITLQDVISEENERKLQDKTLYNNDNQNAFFKTEVSLSHNTPEYQKTHDFTPKTTRYMSSDSFKSNLYGNNKEKDDNEITRQHQYTVNTNPETYRNENKQNDVIYSDGRKLDFTNNIDSRNLHDSKYRHLSPTGKRDVKFESNIPNALVHTSQSSNTEYTNTIPNIKSDENEQGIILDIGLQHIIGVNNQRIIKSFDTTMPFERYPDDKITTIKTVVKSRSTEILMPIDSKDYIKLSFGSGSLDLKGELKTSNDGVIINSQSRISKKGHGVKNSMIRSKSAAPLQARHSGIDRTLGFLYEQQLIPLQKIITNLKDELDILALEQDLLKANITNMRIKKSLRINRTTKCACSCGLKKLNLS